MAWHIAAARELLWIVVTTCSHSYYKRQQIQSFLILEEGEEKGLGMLGFTKSILFYFVDEGYGKIDWGRRILGKVEEDQNSTVFIT